MDTKLTKNSCVDQKQRRLQIPDWCDEDISYTEERRVGMAHATFMLCASNVRYTEGEKDKRKLPIFPFRIFQILLFFELEDTSTSRGEMAVTCPLKALLG